MSDARQVVICDDDDQRVQDWKARVETQAASTGLVVTALPPNDFAQAVKALNERLTAAKAGDWSPRSDAATVIDNADLLVLDSDLTPDPSSAGGAAPSKDVQTYLAGEIGSEVARLARAFTTAGAIAVVNQGAKTRTFDLTMMRTATEPADLYLTEEDLDNAQVWGSTDTTGYRPWLWPMLDRLSPLVEGVIDATDLSASVLDTLGLGGRNGLQFTNKQLEALDADSTNIESTTLLNLALTADFGMGLRPKEKTSDELLKRVGVYGLRRWVERIILPSQNVLVDLPHLLQSNPWLVSERGDLSAWNNRRSWWYPAEPEIATRAFNDEASRLLGRNVWNVDQLPPRPRSERLHPSDPVFCEDTSDFRPSDHASDFVSDIEGPYGARFVSDLDDVDYAPRHRLLR